MKKKDLTQFVCQECGYESPQWLGKCPECGNWNTLKEFTPPRAGRNLRMKGAANASRQDKTPKTLDEISYDQKQRMTTGFAEMDTVLGGGIVRGSVMLVAGDPGVGKSTLLLQAALKIAWIGAKVLYISAEESLEQIKLRANRLTSEQNNPNLLLLSLSSTEAIIESIFDTKPACVIVDSIQTIESENVGGLCGSMGQVRYGALELIRTAKNLQIPIIIVGHVTKEGTVAGPMVLSHMVDVVLFLEGEKNTGIKMLRSLKNRFGPVDEVGLFTMQGEGMIEINNPEYIFMTQKQKDVPGSVMTVTIEGSRAFLVEIQAIVNFTKFPMPRRVVTGIDPKRLELLIAVLQKHIHLPFGTMDIFVNVVGGLKIVDPACDLGICLALFSSLNNVVLPKTVGIAEVGLLGEMRSVPFLEKRVKEAEKLGFKTIITAKDNATLSIALKKLGFYTKEEKQWHQEDERHWKI